MKSRKGSSLIPKPNIPPTPEPQRLVLPNNGQKITEQHLTFSFSTFDREHELFNLGGLAPDKTVGGNWFISLLDALKEISGKTVSELKRSTFDLHPVDWRGTNMRRPSSSEDLEYWQLRLSKSKGRIIGIKLDNIFYVVYLDPHHNATDSEGYGGVAYYPRPESQYEQKLRECEEKSNRIAELEKEISEFEKLI